VSTPNAPPLDLHKTHPCQTTSLGTFFFGSVLFFFTVAVAGFCFAGFDPRGATPSRQRHFRPLPIYFHMTLARNLGRPKVLMVLLVASFVFMGPGSEAFHVLDAPERSGTLINFGLLSPPFFLGTDIPLVSNPPCFFLFQSLDQYPYPLLYGYLRLSFGSALGSRGFQFFARGSPNCPSSGKSDFHQSPTVPPIPQCPDVHTFTWYIGCHLPSSRLRV